MDNLCRNKENGVICKVEKQCLYIPCAERSEAHRLLATKKVGCISLPRACGSGREFDAAAILGRSNHEENTWSCGESP